jgi:hypothetical protein
MRIHALCSWYQENPEHLSEMVASVAPLVDSVVAVDGPYPLYPHNGETSSDAEYEALRSACEAHGLECHLYSPGALPEVDKRAFMFEAALSVSTPHEDWFLIMDGDMTLDPGVDVLRAREFLSETSCDVAEVTFAELAYKSDNTFISANRFRSLFRALPGLTVEGTHWLYVVPREDGSRRFLWHSPAGWSSPEPALDLSGDVCLVHRPHVRERERIKNRAAYYDRRDTAAAERVPIYGASDE